ncbi:MAG: phosphoribosylglycinamide formyltransferase, partial [Myxococcota bacterium]
MTERLGILISGRGSNMAAILDAIADGELRAEARLVLSNKAAAPGLERARAAGVRTAVVRHRDYPSREAFDEAMVAELKAVEVDWVVLAGFMRIVTPVFLRAFPWRVVNIHPSLLPAFVGVDAQAQALAYGVKVSGCTVHLVDEGVDAGPILAQAAVPVRPDD